MLACAAFTGGLYNLITRLKSGRDNNEQHDVAIGSRGTCADRPERRRRWPRASAGQIGRPWATPCSPGRWRPPIPRRCRSDISTSSRICWTAFSTAAYNKNWNESSTTTSHAYRSVTLLEYGLTPRLSVSLLPQFGYNDSNGGQSSNGPQLGDITVRAHYMLTQFEEGGWLPTTAIAVAQSLPTGRYDGLGANPANGLGSGIASTTVGFWVQDYFWMPTGRILRARLNLSYAFADENASVHGVSVYGTGPGFSGKVDTGDTFTADRGVRVQPHPALGAGLRSALQPHRQRHRCRHEQRTESDGRSDHRTDPIETAAPANRSRSRRRSNTTGTDTTA